MLLAGRAGTSFSKAELGIVMFGIVCFDHGSSTRF